MNFMINSNSDVHTDTISYLELLQRIIAKKYIILITASIFLIGGILIAATSHKEYESISVILSEADDGGSGLGQLGGFAGMAGLNLNLGSQNRSSFSPEMYPDVLKSRTFLATLLEEEFYFASRGQIYTLKQYYLEERPGNVVSKSFSFILSLPNRFINLFTPAKETVPLSNTEVEESRLVKFTSQDEYVIGQLRKRIDIDKQKQMMTLKVKAPEATISAELNEIVLSRLKNYATNYKTEKQRVNLEFVEERTKEAEDKFREAQMMLASFRDANQGMVSQRARTREEFLQAEFNVAFNVYNTLKQESEQTRIQLKKETPLFTIFEPAVVPLGNAEPKVSLIIMMSLFLGLFLGFAIAVLIVLKDFITNSFRL
ncbi:MAG TPA: GNVR domain-containing protein [Anditalea sp.]|nr:GNVR domain-containing protein [Anditalea sp.]